MSCVNKWLNSEGNLIVCDVNLAKGRGLFQTDTRYILSSEEMKTILVLSFLDKEHISAEIWI